MKWLALLVFPLAVIAVTSWRRSRRARMDAADADRITPPIQRYDALSPADADAMRESARRRAALAASHRRESLRMATKDEDSIIKPIGRFQSRGPR